MQVTYYIVTLHTDHLSPYSVQQMMKPTVPLLPPELQQVVQQIGK